MYMKPYKLHQSFKPIVSINYRLATFDEVNTIGI
jgi:hypothetical protein